MTGILWMLGLGSVAAEPSKTGPKSDVDSWSALDLAERALVDTLYYNFEPWFPRFDRSIRRLEALPSTRVNQLELMRLYFYRAGLSGELTHVLSFSSKFKIEKIKKDFLLYSGKAKGLAEVLLENPKLSEMDRADAYFFLGMSEGYIAMLEYGEGHLFSEIGRAHV